MIRCFHILLICEILLCPLTCPLAVLGSDTDSSDDQRMSCCSHCTDRDSEECPDIPHPEQKICQCFCSQAYTVQTAEQQSLDADLWSISHVLDTASLQAGLCLTDASTLHFLRDIACISTCDGRAMRLHLCSLTC